MAADETKKTSTDGAPAETPAPEAAEKPAKKPAAKKPAAKAPAKASKRPAAKAAAEAAEKPAAKKPSAAKKPAAKAPAKADKAAAAKPAAEAATESSEKPAAKAAPKKSARKPAAKPAPAPAAERPPKPRREKKTLPEPRRGAPGVATVVDAAGTELESRDLNKAVFAVTANVGMLHLVVRAEQAARRRGTASTKTRGEVSGSTAKLYRQKGTGRARAGSVKSPLRTGGGVVFGPHPRSFDIKVNRKVARKALAMALSDRAEHGNVFVAGGLQMDAPSTRTMNEFLVKLGIAAPVLVVTHDEPAVAKSVRNLPYAETADVGSLSTERVLRARSLVLTEKAFSALNQV